jgi:hypothetical protein
MTAIFVKVPEEKVVKNRVHLDLSAADTDAEVDRLVALDARVANTFPDWVTLTDPEGNEFCVMR